ncbi:MAG: hypothetical protein ACREBW_03185 [Candidatus Micrarchaeaceae archaeon]
MAAKDDFDLFSKVAEMLELDESESSNFVKSAMARRGHKPLTTWADAEGSGNSGDGGDFFSSRRQSREVKRGGNKSGDWQYQSGTGS